MTNYGSAQDLAHSLRRAALAHHDYEARIGQADANWADWYAQFMVDEQQQGPAVWEGVCG